MSHSKIHIMGGGSRPIANTRWSANGSMYMPCSIAWRESVHRLDDRVDGRRVVREPLPRPVLR